MTRTSINCFGKCSALIITLFIVRTSPALAACFTTGAADALKFGTHEIVLVGNGAVSNPFDARVAVRFTLMSGFTNAVTVPAFYDGGNTWRARLYVSEAGQQDWSSSCSMDDRLDGKSGTFKAVESRLRGLLKKHRVNPHAWMTDDGRTFINVSDTAYRLFHGKDAPMWREFVTDSTARGVTCVRVASLGGWGGTPEARVDDNNTWVWNDPWAGGAKEGH